MTTEQQAAVDAVRIQPFFYGVQVQEQEDGVVTVSGSSMPDGGFVQNYAYAADGALVRKWEDGPYITIAMMERVGGPMSDEAKAYMNSIPTD